MRVYLEKFAFRVIFAAAVFVGAATLWLLTVNHAAAAGGGLGKTLNTVTTTVNSTTQTASSTVKQTTQAVVTTVTQTTKPVIANASSQTHSASSTTTQDTATKPVTNVVKTTTSAATQVVTDTAKTADSTVKNTVQTASQTVKTVTKTVTNTTGSVTQTVTGTVAGTVGVVTGMVGTVVSQLPTNPILPILPTLPTLPSLPGAPSTPVVGQPGAPSAPATPLGGDNGASVGQPVIFNSPATFSSTSADAHGVTPVNPAQQPLPLPTQPGNVPVNGVSGAAPQTSTRPMSGPGFDFIVLLAIFMLLAGKALHFRYTTARQGVFLPTQLPSG